MADEVVLPPAVLEEHHLGYLFDKNMSKENCAEARRCVALEIAIQITENEVLAMAEKVETYLRGTAIRAVK